MKPGDVIAIVAVVLVLAAAIFYIVRAKRRGQKCIGCPSGCNCKSCPSQCNCQDKTNKGDN